MTYIYESPDGGQTVYRRDFGSVTKEPYIMSGSPVKYTYGMWASIQKAAMTSPAIEEALEKLIVLYELSKPND
jgi:hypothetical protein